MAKRLVPSLNRVLAPSKSVPAASLLPEKITKVNPEEVVSGGFGARGRDGKHMDEAKLGEKEYVYNSFFLVSVKF
ncbi:hypothetical protein ACHQM5_013736 [Ranunculus cassubicifolius]